MTNASFEQFVRSIVADREHWIASSMIPQLIDRIFIELWEIHVEEKYMVTIENVRVCVAS